MFARSCGSAAPGSLGSTVGQLAIARICEFSRVHDDRGRALGLVRLADAGEHLLGPRLDLGIDRQLQVLAVLRAADRVALDLLAEPVEGHRALAAGGAEQVVVGGLEPGESLVVDPDVPITWAASFPSG